MTKEENPVTQAEGVSRPTTWLPYFFLAVIVILGLGVLFPAGKGEVYPATKAKAHALESQLETACMAYMSVYGALPSTSENYRLVKILCEDNPRKIAFLAVKQPDINPNGDLIDSWGTPSRITFESDSKVGAISAGPDKIFGTPDDITNR